MQRLRQPTIRSTGTIRCVIAVLASSVATRNAGVITAAALAIAFVVLTSPVSGHAIANAALRRSGHDKGPRRGL